MSSSIRLVTDETTVYFSDPSESYLIAKDKAFLLFRPKGRFLIVGFLQHVQTEETKHPDLVKEAIAKDIGIVYVCDKLPKNPIISPNIVYIKVQWAWLIHTLFFNPLLFKGVFGNGETNRLVRSFHYFTNYNIPIIEDVEELEDVNEQHIKGTDNLLFEINGGIGDHLLCIPTLKTLAEQGKKIHILIDKHRDACFKGLKYIHKIYHKKQEINTAEFDNINWLNFGSFLNDYRRELNQQNRIYAVSELCHVNPDELTRDIPEIILTPDEIAKAEELVNGYDKTLFFGFDSARCDSRIPTDFAQTVIDKVSKEGFTVFTTSTRNLELNNCVNLTGKLNLREVFALINAAQYVLTIDTSFLHIAGAFEKRIFALVNYFDPEWRTSTYKNCTSYEPNISCKRCAGGWYIPAKQRQCKGGKTCFPNFEWDKIIQDIKNAASL